MSRSFKPPTRADWNADGNHAWLYAKDEEPVARLELTQWFRGRERDPVVAWIVSWTDVDGADPVARHAPVEVPAQPGDGPSRATTLISAATIALTRGEMPPPPRAPVLPAPPTARERFQQVELLIDAWDRSNVDLSRSLDEDRPEGEFAHYLRLSDVLARTYAVDRTLQGMWEGIPVDLREDASVRTDERAQRAIKHNTSVSARFGQAYAPTQDSSFAAYFAREADCKPYRHWTGHLLTGGLQEEFFLGLRWVRGQMTYSGVTSPIELWPYRDGAEPRWKWKNSQAVSLTNGNKRERALYDRFLAGRDVTGYFSHLLEIFWDAKWSLWKLMLRAETRRPGKVR